MHLLDSDPKSPERLEVELLDAQFQLEQNKRRLEKLICAQAWAVVVIVFVLLVVWYFFVVRPW